MYITMHHQKFRFHSEGDRERQMIEKWESQASLLSRRLSRPTFSCINILFFMNESFRFINILIVLCRSDQKRRRREFAHEKSKQNREKKCDPSEASERCLARGVSRNIMNLENREYGWRRWRSSP
eukprot:Gregarina_sp_Pseudo_9__1112@NODE_1726_length_1367_cov_168_386295_g1600_i0_p3_GENE_NODE_1726_length_1367_cov_168_386295_g1600_i0NODE_1726_length_1367_cov_168_386295_g1600_i0_p3_ORF_typecomplete_len125_score0_90_NODE_1726_length_1367_cov_168_386295_g1600_i0281655